MFSFFRTRSLQSPRTNFFFIGWSKLKKFQCLFYITVYPGYNPIISDGIKDEIPFLGPQ